MSNININNDSLISPERHIFWMDDISILYKNGNYTKFVPTSTMSRVEQLNALTRFFIYLMLIFFMFETTNEYIYIPIIGIIMIIVLYNIYDYDEDGKRAELLRMKRRNEDIRAEQSELNYRTYQVDNDGDVVTVDIDKEEEQRYQDQLDALSTQSTDYDLEAGYLDSNNKLNSGKFRDAVKSLKEQQKDENIRFSLGETRLYENAKCRKPTVDNPFMNPSVDDFNKEDVPVACNADDEDISDQINLKFNEDLYRDIEDVFDKKNSQRQFYTIAHNVPNDQEAFARWCYKFPATCKTNQERCLRYEDLRMKY